MEGLPKAKVISLEVAVYTLPAVIAFCAKHHEVLMGDTPNIVSRTFRIVEQGGTGLAFESVAIYDIFGMTCAAPWFISEAMSDMEMIHIGMNGLTGRFDLSPEVVLVALFGVNIPAEIAAVIHKGRFEELASAIAKVIKASDVDWDEKWLNFSFEPVAK